MCQVLIYFVEEKVLWARNEEAYIFCHLLKIILDKSLNYIGPHPHL